MIPVIIEHQSIRNDKASIRIIVTSLPSVPQIGSYIKFHESNELETMKVDKIEYRLDEEKEFKSIIISNLI